MPQTPRRSEFLSPVRLYPWEADLIRRAVELEGVRASEYIRAVLVDVSRRRVARAEREASEPQM